MGQKIRKRLERSYALHEKRNEGRKNEWNPDSGSRMDYLNNVLGGGYAKTAGENYIGVGGHIGKKELLKERTVKSLYRERAKMRVEGAKEAEQRSSERDDSFDPKSSLWKNSDSLRFSAAEGYLEAAKDYLSSGDIRSAKRYLKSSEGIEVEDLKGKAVIPQRSKDIKGIVEGHEKDLRLIKKSIEDAEKSRRDKYSPRRLLGAFKNNSPAKEGKGNDLETEVQEYDHEYWSIISIVSFSIGALLFSPRITGNVVGISSNPTTSWLGGILIGIGLLAGFFWLKRK